MKTVKLHLAQGRHNVVHRIVVSINDEDLFLSTKTPRDLGDLVRAGFSSTKVANAQKELVDQGDTVLEVVGKDLHIDENYVRRFFRDVA